MLKFSPVARLDLLTAVAADRTLPPAALAVYVTLAKRASHTSGQCFPSLKRIADDLGITRRTVVTAIRALAERLWITIKRRLGKAGDHISNTYQLLTHRDRQRLQQPEPPPPPPVDKPEGGSESPFTTPPGEVVKPASPPCQQDQLSLNKKSVLRTETARPPWAPQFAMAACHKPFPPERPIQRASEQTVKAAMAAMRAILGRGRPDAGT